MKKNPGKNPASRKTPTDKPANGLKTLAVDIGGTGIKAAILDETGKMLTERERIKTPDNATPKKVLAIVAKLGQKLGDFERASAGFPGVIKKGIVYSAPNLGKGWKEFDLEGGLRKSSIDRSGWRTTRTCKDSEVSAARATNW